MGGAATTVTASTATDDSDDDDDAEATSDKQRHFQSDDEDAAEERLLQPRPLTPAPAPASVATASTLDISHHPGSQQRPAGGDQPWPAGRSSVGPTDTDAGVVVGVDSRAAPRFVGASQPPAPRPCPRRQPPLVYTFPRYTEPQPHSEPRAEVEDEADDVNAGIPYRERLVHAGELLEMEGEERAAAGARVSIPPPPPSASDPFTIVDDDPLPGVELSFMSGDAEWPVHPQPRTDGSVLGDDSAASASASSSSVSDDASGLSSGSSSRVRASPRFEAFSLRVVYEAGRTGFEDAKDIAVPVGSLLAGRFLVHDHVGSAAFSSALACLDTATGGEVCLKVIKNNKDFVDQSLDEIKLLRYVARASGGDPDRYHVLKLHDYFYHREHLFLVTGEGDRMHGWG